MKILATLVAAGAVTVWAEETGAVLKKVSVCVDLNGDASEIRSAEGLASKLFARIGVKIVWREMRSCTADGLSLEVSLSYNTPANQLPGSVAYALPYEGTHIVVFYDRVRQSDPNLVTRLLAYVMAHEITHILEGITRHSKSGIMKAHWDGDDRFQIGLQRLEFALEDVDLIYRGLDARTLAAAASPVSYPLAARE